MLCVIVLLAACGGGGGSSSNPPPPAQTAPAITGQPTHQTVTVGQTATFTVTANGATPLTYAWFLNGAAAGTNSASYSIANAAISQSGAQVYAQISNSLGSVTSSTVTLTVAQPVQSSVN